MLNSKQSRSQEDEPDAAPGKRARRDTRASVPTRSLKRRRESEILEQMPPNTRPRLDFAGTRGGVDSDQNRRYLLRILENGRQSDCRGGSRLHTQG